MDNPAYDKLKETAWRRKLTRNEEAELRAWLTSHPGLQTEWEEENALNDILGGLRDVPVSSNFTARVVQAAAANPADSRRTGRIWGWRAILPRAAIAGVLVALGLGVYRHHEANQRMQLARRVANVSNVVALSGPEAWRDIETVRHLGQTPSADEELLALMQ